ncbi:hypothetical protein EV363DRAFT_1149934 [Boletus edulis]|nr:hypothetical protein EV363DRAFT_1149934 [Boletus edulis]
MPARLPRARLQLEWVLFGFRQFALFIFYVNLKPVASYSTPHVHGNSLRRTVLSSRGVAVQFHTPYEGYPMEPQAEGETGRPHLLLRVEQQLHVLETRTYTRVVHDSEHRAAAVMLVEKKVRRASGGVGESINHSEQMYACVLRTSSEVARVS